MAPDSISAATAGSTSRSQCIDPDDVVTERTQKLDGAWGEVFGDPVIATAVLDRLLHHSITVNIRGDSYRLREKLKAGLLRPKLVSDPGDENDNT
jgi:hypothetical protein